MVRVRDSLICVEMLELGSVVSSADGRDLHVVQLKSWRGKEQELVELKTQHVSLVVTSSHRIMVRKGHRPQPMTARSLHEGDHVLVGGNDVEVPVSVKIFSCVVDTLAITLEPDDPIELFPPPKAILSKGEGYSKTRRGRPPSSSSQGSADTAWSIADTDYSAMHGNYCNIP